MILYDIDPLQDRQEHLTENLKFPLQELNIFKIHLYLIV
jgi:hypothetical protein